MADTSRIVSSSEPHLAPSDSKQSPETRPQDSPGASCSRIARHQTGVECPECGSSMNPDGGCWLCRDCGFSRCG